MLHPDPLPVCYYMNVRKYNSLIIVFLLKPLAISENSGNQITYPIVTQPNTPSKLIGTSPRPSILRKRDYEG